MCIPSSLDPTLAPPGCHVLSLFIQYTPYHLNDATWTDEIRNAFADKGKNTEVLHYPTPYTTLPCTLYKGKNTEVLHYPNPYTTLPCTLESCL